MKQEPANQLLEATYLSELGIKVTANDPVDIEGALEVEMELNNLLLSLRPIRKVCSNVSVSNFCALINATEAVSLRWEALTRFGYIKGVFWSTWIILFSWSLMITDWLFRIPLINSFRNLYRLQLWEWIYPFSCEQEQLIGDNHKLVLLAALSDSLDFVSESVQQ